jgi:hypothetical protein
LVQKYFVKKLPGRQRRKRDDDLKVKWQIGGIDSEMSPVESFNINS